MPLDLWRMRLGPKQSALLQGFRGVVYVHMSIPSPFSLSPRKPKLYFTSAFYSLSPSHPLETRGRHLMMYEMATIPDIYWREVEREGAASPKEGGGLLPGCGNGGGREENWWRLKDGRVREKIQFRDNKSCPRERGRKNNAPAARNSRERGRNSSADKLAFSGD